MLVPLLLATSLTFPQALDRAIRARGAAEFYDTRASALESARALPLVRAETGASSANDLNLITSRVTRVDALTALITVDYPLLSNSQRELRAEAALLRDRAAREEDAVFRETLDAFARLYIAESRLALLPRPGKLREKSENMLAAGIISNTTAAQWQDQALAAESMLVDLELQRLDAETRLKQLIGDTSDEPLQVVALDDIPPRTRPHFEQDDAFAWRKPQLMMSAFGGVANVSDGTFGLYGLRFTLSLPLLDGTAQRRIIAAQEAARTRTLEETSQKNRVALLRMTATSTDQRIALLTKAVDVAKQREASVTRLVRAGVRTEGDVLDAMNDVARRESELLAVRVERWKLEQQLRWEQ